MSSSPAILLISKFVMSGAKEYEKYIDYIDRDDAKLKVEVQKEKEEFTLFYNYMDYMEDEEKQGALFTDSIDELNLEKKIEVKELFAKAEKNGSPMWQDVISFDNEWLEKQKLYDSKTGELKEVELKNAIREGMNEMLVAENMKGSAIWTGSIHHNTDNIHVHIAFVEPTPTREKKWRKDKKTGEWSEQVSGRRKQKSLDKMKSKVINHLMDRSKERNLINDLIRDSVNKKREGQMNLAKDRRTKELFIKAIHRMPSDMKQWKYGYQSVDEARPLIDEIGEIYLKRYHKEDMKLLHQKLDEETLAMKELYGEKSNYKNYKETKMNDLKTRIGNAVITEMREYQKKQRSGERRRNASVQKNLRYQNQFASYRRNELDSSIRRLRYVIRRTARDYHQEQNVREYEQLVERPKRGWDMEM